MTTRKSPAHDLPACIVALAAALCAASGLLAQVAPQRVKTTVHNLSASGPGSVRAESESEVCVFCHTPHGSSGVRPLWNRSLPAGPYEIYRSSSLKAELGQPTGSSKLCLSCHDGTIALGEVMSRETPIVMAGGDRMPAGRSNLGTDLADDHPISFPYAASLTAGASGLVPQGAIVPPVALDENGELQCTSCHEAHDNSRGNFLLVSDESGELCASCHRPASWETSAHATSSVVIPGDVAATLGVASTSVARAACNGCHATHGAAGKPWLLDAPNITATCVTCHQGTVAQTDLAREIQKLSNHGMVTEGTSPLTSDPYLEGDRVSCADCHDAHASGSSEGVSGSAPTSLARVPGVALSGAAVASVAYEHELCLRCHGDAPAQVRLTISRQLMQPNKRLQFQPSSPSFHPIGNPGVNPDVPSLAPPLTTASTIECGDCHASDGNRKLGGSAPAGPHGSVFEPLLALRYDTDDYSIESPESYALCYRCHQRDSILGDESFPAHRRHIVEERVPCSACHDPHGISSAQGTSLSNSHLLNFDTAIVLRSSNGRMEFRDLGRFRGECSVSCHGEDHDAEAY